MEDMSVGILEYISFDEPSYQDLLDIGLVSFNRVHKKWPEFSDYVKDVIQIPNNLKWSEALYWYFNNISERPKCPICGNLVRYKSFGVGYLKYCSIECSAKSEETKLKRASTFKEHYGAESIFSTSEFRERSRQSLLERYGVETVAHIPAVRKKIEDTCRKRYGNPWTVTMPENRVLQKKAIRERMFENNPDILESNEDGSMWRCRCPHPECNLCDERSYWIPSRYYHRRKDRGAELCTNLEEVGELSSSAEAQIRMWLENKGIPYVKNDRKVLHGRELDLYFPDRRLAIEVNGSYWHSSEVKEKYYHMDKWNKCKDQGIRLVSIWEEWILHDWESVIMLLEYHLDGMEIDFDRFRLDPMLVDLGLVENEEDYKICEHSCIYDGHLCWDTGIYVKNT